MCHIVVSKHTYSECKLLDTAEPGPIPSIPDGQSPTPVSAARHVSQLSRLMRSIHRSVMDNAQTSSEAGLPSIDTQQARTSSEVDIHVVTQKTFLQCHDARDPDHEDAHMWDIPVNKRTCSDPTEMELPGDAVDDEDYVFKSELRGRCPVCEAAESAIAQNIVKITVTPAKPRAIAQNSRTLNLGQAQNEQLDVPQPHPHSKRSRRHKHHGSGKGRKEGERAATTGGNHERRGDRESSDRDAVKVGENNGERIRHSARKRKSWFRRLFE